jgi:glycosyltransferase involved in cell wall biosynthesis
MKVAINTRFLLKNKLEGFGWFTHEVVSRMVKNHPEHEFIFFFDRSFDPKFIYADNVTPVVLNPPARHPVLFKIWFNWSVKRALKKYKTDIFFSPDGYMSLTSKMKQVGVIHDLNFEHYPQDLPKKARKYLLKYFPLFAEKATKIITVSEYSKQDIIDTYQVNPDKIKVAYNGIGGFFKPISISEKEVVRRKFTSGKDYFLFVGALHPRKNMTNLFKAFDLYKTQTNSEVKLLVVGEKYWWSKEIKMVFENLTHKNDIVFTGHVQSSELNEIYGAGLALVFPSYFEGFGIPLVEAMKCELPIISSNTTCLPEIAGDAAIYVDPFSVESIAAGMTKIASDEELRTRLIEKGKERSELFNWDKTAEICWEVIEEVAKK